MSFRLIPSISLLMLALSLHVKAESDISTAPAAAYPAYGHFRCSGFPQVMVSSTDKTCLGLVADKTNGLRMPRYAVQASDGTIYISDMGSWGIGTGTIWALQIPLSAQPTDKITMTNLFPNDKLTMPNGLLLDPEGRLYVGTPTGLYRFHPKKPTGEFNIDSDLETIENGFMSSIFRKDEYASASAYNNTPKNHKHRHPLVQLAANKDFTEIYMNVGAPSDDCTSGLKTKNDQGLCVQSESPLVNAGIWKTTLSANLERKKIKTEALARGLRNSMGLAVHPTTQKLYQAENSMDLPDADVPFEEINLIEPGHHYGWPYCHTIDKVNAAFADVVKPEDCRSKYTGPLINMKAHTAPLGLLFYQSNHIPTLTGKLLVSLHGYREYGQKVVSYTLDEKGLPTSYTPELVLYNWAAKNAVRPQGAPTGLTELNDGRILVIDDKNRSVLILDLGENYQDSPDQEQHSTVTPEQIAAIKPLQSFLNKNCKTCHSKLAESDPQTLVENLFSLTLVDQDEPFKSKLLIRIQNRTMPMGQPLDEATYLDAIKKIKTFLETVK